MVGAYALIVMVAGRSVITSRDGHRASIHDQLETSLQDTVAAWEDELLQTLTGWMEAATQDVSRASALQHQMRRRAPWFNSLYIWDPPRTLRVGPKELDVPAQLVFPNPPVADTVGRDAGRLCIHRARIYTADPSFSPEQVARAYIDLCKGEPLGVRMHASSEAAHLLDNHRKREAALAALEAARVPDALTLSMAAQDGVPPFRLVIHRLQQAELLDKLGRTEEALDLLQRVGTEITALDAPSAEPLLAYITWPVLQSLRQAGRNDAVLRLEDLKERADRRVAAYREISDRILVQTPRAGTSELPQVIFDQYSNTPFLLYFGFERDHGVALQLERDRLVDDFLGSKSVARFQRWLVVTDASDNVVAGSRRPGDVAIRVPFRSLLTQLRVGLREGAIDELTRDGQWITQLGVVILCAFLGLFALVVQILASRQQQELLTRQREFTTRVTHELKTPLAGIRVMAENLELGAFRDQNQLAEMAGRIVAEADRLTARVEEVLDAARQRTIPQPEPFDPEESLLEAIDHWGPRLENVGVQLLADLEPTSEVLGDVDALRDAVGCLLDNALKYRDRDRDDPRVELSLRQRKRKVIIEVRDNGMGVPPDKRKAIFERFVRVEGPNRGLAGGYGLGLAQVAQIAAALKGQIRCEAGIDGGASFVLELPALTEAPPEL